MLVATHKSWFDLFTYIGGSELFKNENRSRMSIRKFMENENFIKLSVENKIAFD